MTELICDICGTTYPETDEKCPTCGYSRGLTVFTPYDGQEHTAHEKIRGGRFSKKNVQKRLLERAEAEHEPVETVVHEAVAEAAVENEDVRAVQDLTAQMSAAVAALNGQDQPAAEAKAEPAQPVDEEPAAAEDLTVEELPIVETEPAMGENSEPAPGESDEQQPEESEELPSEETEEEDEEKAALAAYKRDVRMNLLLFFSSVVFLLSSAYLVITYGIPYVRTLNLPAQVVTEAPTEAATEAVTEMLTKAPTEAPTEAPTQAPTEAPTQAPTQAPTEELLDVELELNYYDLTFGAATQSTQLQANVIPNEDITWISDDPAVVTVSETGLIKAVGGGQTTVRAIYGDQEVTVKINCRF